SYLSRFEANRQPEDIAKAVDHLQQAIAHTPEGHYKEYTDPMVLERAIEAQIRAVSLVPDGHSDYPGFYSRLGRLYLTRAEHSPGVVDLASAAISFELSAKSQVGHPRHRFKAAHAWAMMSFKLSLSDSLEAFQVAIDLIPQLIWLGTTVEDRYKNLPQLGDLIQQAVAAAIGAEKHGLALEWLEQGRSVVWGQTLQLRTPLDDLSSVSSSLAQELQKTADELHRASSGPAAPRIGHTTSLDPSTSFEQASRNHRSMAIKYERLLSEVRDISGFERFMLPKTTSELLRAAATHPVVVVNIQESHSDALVLIPGSSDVQHIPLPDMTHDKAETARIRMRHSLNGRGSYERRGVKIIGECDYFPQVLATLWTDLVKPVLKELGYIASIYTFVCIIR
ncbi:unnamed protein product, partial [Rhizoctonia solani]